MKLPPAIALMAIFATGLQAQTKRSDAFHEKYTLNLQGVRFDYPQAGMNIEDRGKKVLRK